MTLYRRELVQQSTDGNGVASVWRYVPVEPDYEAAEAEHRQQLRTGPHDTRAILEAAGIGGSDEVQD